MYQHSWLRIRIPQGHLTCKISAQIGSKISVQAECLFLLPKQQCQSTNEHSKQWSSARKITHWTHPFFIHLLREDTLLPLPCRLSDAIYANVNHETPRLPPFNGPMSGTTQVSRYQKSKTNLDFTAARDSGISWAICNLHLAPDR